MRNVVNCAYKDLKLAFHLSIVIYMFIGVGLFFAPNYPAYIGPFFVVMGIMTSFNMDLANHDREFCCIMPISKADAVRGRVLAVALLEIFTILACIPSAFLGSRFIDSLEGVTEVFIKPNCTLFAVVLLGYAIANMIIILAGYSKQFKVGIRGLICFLLYVLLIGAAEGISRIPHLDFLRDNSADALMKQLPVLIGSIVIYVGFMLLTTKLAIKRFERTNI